MTGSWLEHHGLHAIGFAIRRDAAQTLLAPLTLGPDRLPRHDDAPRLVRHARGSYSSADGRFTVHRRANRRSWTVTETRTAQRVTVLTLAASAVARQVLI